MATLISRGNINFTGSWGVVDTTSLLSSEAGSDVLTTAYSGTRSSAFTPGAITVDGIAVKIAVRSASPTGTISVQLELDTGNVAVAGTEVTLNVSDLPLCTLNDREGGWIFFEFATPVSLLAATAYQVAAKTSSGSMVSLWTDGTTDNVSRLLCTTTTASPGAGDTMLVMGEHTGAGTGNDFTVTMDNTATTDFGAGTADIDALSVSKRGTLTWGVSASTNYYLKLSGDLTVYAGGTYNMGTTGSPMPSTSTGVLEFDPAADGDMGFTAMNLSTVNIQGASKTVVWTNLTSDAAAAATSVVVTSTSGWAANDELVFASTTRTASEAERRTISTVDSATGITLTAGLTNAHSGTSPTQGEVGNITRNIKIRSATSTVMAYFSICETSSVDIDYAELYYLGEDATDQRGAFNIKTTTGSFSAQYSSIHDTEDYGIYISGTTSNNIVFSNNVCYDINTAAVSGTSVFRIGATSGTTITLNANLFCKSNVNTTSSIQFNCQDIGLTFTNNIITGCQTSTAIGAYVINETASVMGTFSGNIIHSNVGSGICVNSNLNSIVGTISNSTIYRNGGNGFAQFAGTLSPNYIDLDTCNFIGNTTNNVYLVFGIYSLVNCIIKADPSFSTTNGLVVSGSTVFLRSCDFSATTAHTNDLVINSGSTYGESKIFAFNTPLRASTETASLSSELPNSAYFLNNYDGGSTHKIISRFGTVASDTTTRHTGSGLSWKLTPNSATRKLVYPGPHQMDTHKVAVVANSAVTINAYVYKDSSYNGNAPRLVLVGGVVPGILADVTDSLTVAHSNWEQLTVTGTPTADGVLEFYVDCDGTAGNVYVDDISVSQ